MILYTVQTRKRPSLKLNKLNEISIRSLENYTKEKFLELLRKNNFPGYTTFTYLNKVYQGFIFIFKSSEVIDFFAQVKK